MYRFAKRALDILLALVLLVLGAPLLLCIAIGIKLDSPGPIFYKQVRSGKNGEPFSIIKFRTMRPHVVDPFLAISPEHPLVTGLGRFLRRSKLDEMPNAINILKGEMSFVGPRPTLPEQVALYTERQRRRLDVLPGITGWSQVNGNAELSWADRIELDVWYVENRSLRLDLQIIASTVFVVLFGERVRPVKSGAASRLAGGGETERAPK